jgi:hypothetical protein
MSIKERNIDLSLGEMKLILHGFRYKCHVKRIAHILSYMCQT